MSEPSRGPQPSQSFSKATVDRWQVFGGVAGVVALGLTVVNAIKDVIPLSFAASIVVAIVGIVLLNRWGSQSDQRTLRTFLIPILVTVVGAATAGVTGGLSLQKTIGTVSMEKVLPVDSSGNRVPQSTNTSTTANPPGSSKTSSSDSGTSSSNPSNAPVATNVEVLRQERLTIHRGLYLDLDSLNKDRGIQKTSTPSADLNFYGSIVMGGGGKVYAYASDGFSYDDCAATVARTEYVSTSEFEEGSKFCLKTTEGRWALLTVAERRVSEKPENDEIEFNVLVWAQR
jgi:hypothetical protein